MDDRNKLWTFDATVYIAMYLRWKKKTHGVASWPTLACPHVGTTIISMAPVLVVSARTGHQKTPRQHVVWRPGGAMRLCCMGSALARAAWWTATEQRWDNLNEYLYEDGVEDESRGVYEDIVADQRHWFHEMAKVITPPTPAERILYGKALRRRLHIDPLGLQWPFTEADLRRAWRQAALETHPDRGGSQESFVRAKESYEEGLRLLGASRRVA